MSRLLDAMFDCIEVLVFLLLAAAMFTLSTLKGLYDYVSDRYSGC